MELLHIMEPGSYGIDFTIEHPNEREQKRKRATERLEALSSELARPGITVKMSLSGGAPADTILEVAQNPHAT